MTGKSHAEYMRRLFTKIAPRYDLVNTLMSLGQDRWWRRKAALWSNPSSSTLALDLATGTGEMAIALAQGKAQVIGVDICPGMVRWGKGKALRLGKGGQIHFLLGDALSLPFPDNTFDIATIGFALRDVESIPRCLVELHRILKRGGRLVCLELTRPRLPILGFFFALYLKKIVPLLGRFFGKDGDTYTFLFRSLNLYPAPRELKVMMEEAGLSQVRFRLYGLGTVALHGAVK